MERTYAVTQVLDPSVVHEAVKQWCDSDSDVLLLIKIKYTKIGHIVRMQVGQKRILRLF